MSNRFPCFLDNWSPTWYHMTLKCSQANSLHTNKYTTTTTTHQPLEEPTKNVCRKNPLLSELHHNELHNDSVEIPLPCLFYFHSYILTCTAPFSLCARHLSDAEPVLEAVNPCWMVRRRFPGWRVLIKCSDMLLQITRLPQEFVQNLPGICFALYVAHLPNPAYVLMLFFAFLTRVLLLIDKKLFLCF